MPEYECRTGEFIPTRVGKLEPPLTSSLFFFKSNLFTTLHEGYDTIGQHAIFFRFRTHTLKNPVFPQVHRDMRIVRTGPLTSKDQPHSSG